MAAESQSEVENLKLMGDQKIIRVDGWLVGCSGEKCPPMHSLAKWFGAKKGLESRKPWPRYKFDLLLLSPDHKLYLLDQNGDLEEVHEPFWAVGSGAEVCIGALSEGAPAERAVLRATKYAAGCGGAITVETLDDRPVQDSGSTANGSDSSVSG